MIKMVIEKKRKMYDTKKEYIKANENGQRKYFEEKIRRSKRAMERKKKNASQKKMEIF